MESEYETESDSESDSEPEDATPQDKNLINFVDVFR